MLFVNAGKVLFAPYTVAGDSFRADKPQAWTATGAVVTPGNYAYDIHPDGKRLAFIAAADPSTVQDKVVFVSNFIDYLKKTVPAGK